MRRLVLLFPFALAACVATPEAPTAGMTPREAVLSTKQLSVLMSNGKTCFGGVLTDGAKSWNGPLAGCPEGWRYRVVLSDSTNPARFIVEEVLTALTIEDALAPRAEVTITDPNNNATTFVSP
jgi:hypothetical protein